MNELLVCNLNSLNNSIYTYRINEHKNEFLIFDIVLNHFDKIDNKIRLLKKSRNGKLISYQNEIKYKMINKININCININNINKSINMEYYIDHNSDKTEYSNDVINIKIYNKKDYLIIKYNLLNI